MIYTANTSFDSSHLANFTQEVDEFINSAASMTTYYNERGVYVPGTNNYLDVHMKFVRSPQGNTIILICKQNSKNVFVARFVSAPIPQGTLPWGYKNYIADRVKVHSKWAGHGVCGAVYSWMSNRGFTIISDSHQNQNSLAVWKKLATKEKVFMLDINAMNWKPYDPTKVEDWVVFGNGNFVEYWPVRFVLPAAQ